MNTSTPDTSQSTQPSFAPADAAPTVATILLAEDDRSIRRYLEVILRRGGYNVVAVADGLEAMKAALSSTVDAVVTDALMPHLSGQDLCRFFRRHPKLSRLPVVLLSGIKQPVPPASTSAAEHADAYLAKPVRPEELNACLARLLAQGN